MVYTHGQSAYILQCSYHECDSNTSSSIITFCPPFYHPKLFLIIMGIPSLGISFYIVFWGSRPHSISGLSPSMIIIPGTAPHIPSHVSQLPLHQPCPWCYAFRASILSLMEVSPLPIYPLLVGYLYLHLPYKIWVLNPEFSQLYVIIIDFIYTFYVYMPIFLLYYYISLYVIICFYWYIYYIFM